MKNSSANNIVVVGASIAGLHAVEALREFGFEGSITLINAEDRLPYDKPPLSKAFLKGEESDEAMLLQPAEWFRENEIVLEPGKAMALDTLRQEITLANTKVVPYDGLVLATGLTARQGPSFFRSVDNVFTIRTWEDSVTLRDKLVPEARVVIVGGGFIGLEVASVAKQAGCHVSIVERTAEPLQASLGQEAGHWFRLYHESHGIEFFTENSIVGVNKQGAGAEVCLADGRTLFADCIVLGLGAAPNTEWLVDSGVNLVQGGIQCDCHLRTNIKNIVAAGDVACWENVLYGEPIRVEHWTNAVEQGRYAAATLLDREQEPYIGPPYFWTDQFEAFVRSVGYIPGHDESAIVISEQNRLVVIYGKAGKFRGAVCANHAPSLLAYRPLLMKGASFKEALSLRFN